MSALPAPDLAAVVAEWRPDPLPVVAAAVLAWWYATSVRSLAARGVTWPRGRSAVFGLGVALAVWTSSGFLSVYAGSLYWVWTTRALVLLLLVPLVLLQGQPVRLARLAGGRSRAAAESFLRSPVARILGNPLVGPALVPLLSAALFFGPLAGWAIRWPTAGSALSVLLVVAGALILLPLVDLDGDASSLAVGAALAIGSFELVLDAIPGIALRLHTSLVSGWFDHRTSHPWSPRPLTDQHAAGAVLWCVAELIDLPFLLLVFRRWLRADAREAAAADAVLEAERAARAALPGVTNDADAPWWLSDPSMQDRLRRSRD